jgi:membrane-associated phospholipid phosphatase
MQPLHGFGSEPQRMAENESSKSLENRGPSAGARLRVPTPEQLERFIPYPFLVTWAICAAAVYGDAVFMRSGASRVHNALAAIDFGFLAAGLVVGLLTLAHGTAWRLLGHAESPAAAPGGLSERRLRLLFLAFLVAAAAALSVDCRLAHWCVAQNCPRFLHDLLEPFAVFGEFTAAIVVLLAIHQLDRSHRRRVWWVLSCVLLSGLAANGAKMLLARTRPYDFDFHHGVLASFGHWLPVNSLFQSLPSGHTATAGGLALGLMAVYPHGRKLFLLLVLLVACQRLECGAHFLSDVFCGAAVSCLTVACCLRLARWFPRSS